MRFILKNGDIWCGIGCQITFKKISYCMVILNIETFADWFVLIFKYNSNS